jgi:hypothetical protein
MISKTRRDTLDRRRSKKVRSNISAALFVSGILSIIILLSLLKLSRFTFIPMLDLAGVFLASGMVAWLILLAVAGKFQLHKLNMKTPLLGSVMVFGIWGSWLFLLLNWQFATHRPKQVTTPILDSWQGDRPPTFYIRTQYKTFVKTYGFGVEEQSKLKQSGYVELNVDKGLFGYEILLEKKPKVNK